MKFMYMRSEFEGILAEVGKMPEFKNLNGRVMRSSSADCTSDISYRHSLDSFYIKNHYHFGRLITNNNIIAKYSRRGANRSKGELLDQFEMIGYEKDEFPGEVLATNIINNPNFYRESISFFNSKCPNWYSFAFDCVGDANQKRIVKSSSGVPPSLRTKKKGILLREERDKVVSFLAGCFEYAIKDYLKNKK